MTMDITPHDSKVSARSDWILAPIRRWIGTIRRHLKLHRQRRIDRLAYNHMLALDDAILKDIGVTRHDVISANKLPLSQNAALELRKVAVARQQIGAM